MNGGFVDGILMLCLRIWMCSIGFNGEEVKRRRLASYTFQVGLSSSDT